MNQLSESKSVCGGMCVAPKPFWPTQSMSDSHGAGDPVEPRCGASLPQAMRDSSCFSAGLGAQRIFVVIASTRFGLWRKEYKREPISAPTTQAKFRLALFARLQSSDYINSVERLGAWTVAKVCPAQ